LKKVLELELPKASDKLAIKLGRRGDCKIEFQYFLSTAVTNLLSFAEIVLKLSVCYVGA